MFVCCTYIHTIIEVCIIFWDGRSHCLDEVMNSCQRQAEPDCPVMNLPLDCPNLFFWTMSTGGGPHCKFYWNKNNNNCIQRSKSCTKTIIGIALTLRLIISQWTTDFPWMHILIPLLEWYFVIFPHHYLNLETKDNQFLSCGEVPRTSVCFTPFPAKNASPIFHHDISFLSPVRSQCVIDMAVHEFSKSGVLLRVKEYQIWQVQEWMSIAKFIESVTDYCPTPAPMGWSSAWRIQELGIFFWYYSIIMLSCHVLWYFINAWYFLWCWA